MPTIRTLIVDDERKARETLAHLLATFCEGIEVVGQAEDAATARSAIRALQPQLVFLDIRMPMATGFELLESLTERNFELIFVTAHDNYAIKAFEYAALRYLLKPVNPLDLQAAVDAVRMRMEAQTASAEAQVAQLLQDMRRPDTDWDRIALPFQGGIEFVPVRDLVWMESADSYTVCHLRDGRQLTVSRNLKAFSELLPEADFFRIHHSYLVQLRHLKRFLRTDGLRVVLVDGTELPVSKRRKDAFLQRIGGQG